MEEKLTFEEAFEKYIKGQKIVSTYSYGDYYEGIKCANGYKYVSWGGTASGGGDANTTLILDINDEVVGQLDW